MCRSYYTKRLWPVGAIRTTSVSQLAKNEHQWSKKILTLIFRRKACSDPLSFCYTAIPQMHHIVQRTHASAVSRCHIHLYLLHINYTCAHCLVPDVHFLHLHFNHKAKTSSIFCTNPSIDYVCFPVQLLQLSSHPCNGSVSAPWMRMPRKEVYI